VDSTQLYSAAGNRFVLVDGLELTPEEALELARALVASDEMQTFALDGVLVCVAPRHGGTCGMIVLNRDGSRAEACGNGLRCIARFAVERGLAHEELVIETDAGARPARVSHGEGDVVTVRTGMGVPEIVDTSARLELDGEIFEAALVELGNPHCVLNVDEAARAPVATLGPRFERHPRFPRGTNVGFAHMDSDGDDQGMVLRVWERGVGETAACGTGAAAAAAAAISRGARVSPIRVKLPGGTLTVEWDGVGELFVTGPVEAIAARQRTAS